MAASGKLFRLLYEIWQYYPDLKFPDLIFMVAEGNRHLSDEELVVLAEEFLERINHGEL